MSSENKCSKPKQVIIPDQNHKTIFIIESAEWGNHCRWTAPTIEEKESLIGTLQNNLEDITDDLMTQKEE